MNTSPIFQSLEKELVELGKKDALVALSSIADFKQMIAKEEREAVFSALEHHTWREVGEALGVSKQAVFQRFGRDWIQMTKAKIPKTELQRILKNKLESKR